ncbi:hypothetical protein PUR61_12160 [Streptomyces sp. BE20]|uniref:hypothetical protein n=1 Tax=unclassified Streptomyces TaxID=2593676 RepID=UPI002E7A12AA|nr:MULTISPECIES: hypothetical protein [unclassified Streptomyces]MED7948639.1 hypothetical protein [Streptomyces sp. BE303]MEE1822938.1 hypothetical protein [Streptomyces sp. BE20]
MEIVDLLDDAVGLVVGASEVLAGGNGGEGVYVGRQPVHVDDHASRTPGGIHTCGREVEALGLFWSFRVFFSVFAII